jgi:hypothetical protein
VAIGKKGEELSWIWEVSMQVQVGVDVTSADISVGHIGPLSQMVR